MWFGRRPSLSHLREIGCRAFALIQTHNQKIYQRSRPCILIGYAPNSKSYRLWDSASGKVFNSFHVTFLEHLDALPSSLMPGTTVELLPGSPPSWDSPSLDSPPAVPISSPVLPSQPPVSTYGPPRSSTVPSPGSHSSSISVPNNVAQIQISSPNTVPELQNTSNNTTNQTNTFTIDNSVPNDPSPVTIIPSTIEAPSNSLPDPVTSSAADPPLRRSTRLRFPYSRDATRDGLLPNPRVAAAISDNAFPSPSDTAPSVNDDDDGNVLAFLAEFVPYCDTHYLLPLDLPVSEFSSAPEVLAAAVNGSLEPEMDVDDDPLWSEALASSEREYWIAGAQDEIHSLADLKVFVLVPRSDVPVGQRPLRGKLVCKRKRDDTGKVIRYKVHYVAKGFAQRFGIDYDKTTAPTSRLESLRAISHLAASLDWDLRQFDIKTAFLHGILPADETMYMEQPPGFEVPGKVDWVWRLLKSIYGMKQASRVWNKTFNSTVLGWNFVRLSCEWCVYICRSI